MTLLLMSNRKRNIEAREQLMGSSVEKHSFVVKRTVDCSLVLTRSIQSPLLELVQHKGAMQYKATRKVVQGHLTLAPLLSSLWRRRKVIVWWSTTRREWPVMAQCSGLEETHLQECLIFTLQDSLW